MFDIDTFAKNVLTEGGASASVRTGKAPQSGYMVSIAGHEQTTRARTVSGLSRAVAKYCESNADALSVPGRYLGAWTNGTVVYLDVSVRFNRKRPALRFGADNAQRAVYDVASQASILV
jgi:hypothetical protein